MAAIMQKVFLVLSIVLIMIGLGLSIAGAFSPAWQVVEIREFRVEHQHGLWWDCVRAEKFVVGVGDFYDETPLHCMYKFDSSAEMVIENTLNNIDEDGAAGEAEHHTFRAWHKAILSLIILSLILGVIAICTGVCAPCYSPTAIIFTISTFLAMLLGVIADGVFFIAANRVDNRFVQGMVGTYEQRIGYAFILHSFGTIAFLLAFICALLTTYKFLSNYRNNADNRRSIFQHEPEPLLPSEKYRYAHKQVQQPYYPVAVAVQQQQQPQQQQQQQQQPQRQYTPSPQPQQAQQPYYRQSSPIGYESKPIVHTTVMSAQQHTTTYRETSA